MCRCLMERIVEARESARALKRVRQNKGSPGVDGRTVKDLVDDLRDHWPVIREQLLTGSLPAERGETGRDSETGRWGARVGHSDRVGPIHPAGRVAGPATRDRSDLLRFSYGFRPGRSAHDAVCQAQRYVQEDRHWVVDVDLAQFFDRVNHDILMGKVAKRIVDPRVLTLIRRYLEAGVLASGVVMERHEGTPQGGPLSPLLANVLLDGVDQELERRGLAFVRYADDCNVYVESKRAADRVMEGLVGLYAKLKLQINPTKSAVALVVDRAFLGYRFWRVDRGRIVRRGASLKALATLKARVRDITSRSRGWGFAMSSAISARISSAGRRTSGWRRRRVSWRRWTAGFGVASVCSASCSASTVGRCIACCARAGFSQRDGRLSGSALSAMVVDGGPSRHSDRVSRAYFDGLGIPRLGAL